MSKNASTLTIASARRLPDDFWPKRMQAPYRYDLFQLLRWIDAQGGESYPLGRGQLPRHEPVRLGQEPSLSFAPSTLAKITPRAGKNIHDVSIYSFGLFGPNGPLPLHITEYARERIYHHQDPTLTAFADMFHHRLTLLFYRAWADAQPTVSQDRPDDHRFEHYLASLIGMGQPAQKNADSVNEHARYALSGHLTRHGHDVEGLEKILRYYFNVPVRLIENVPHWLNIDTRQQAQLRAGKRAPRLGQDAFLGVATRDVQHKFIIEMGPLTRAEYEKLLPGTPLSIQLRDWVRQYLGIEYVWEVKLVLRADEVASTRLQGAQRLGLSSWLGRQPQVCERGDLVYAPEHL
ncbi:type VI secretion system baseplate subunit TssG [Affinibrenneria salicis]|uniref:Type VI secretion system baseplate subunit TssG n=1 Tax=Affinibrenneria salicis TaxID=2590031 RepID=A0A5J5FWX1_9GAMM|nr:type VI secretion system baseplate subunit TssG [Affinibrenneria salicis]KAA8998176.1 type VI secretion system baseplate subunit TssG [Affinibrenneria salicis]